MKGTAKLSVVFSFLVILLCPGRAGARPNFSSEAPLDVVPAAAAVEAQAESQAKAYYHYTVGHIYEEMGQLFRRSDYLRRAIDEYKQALKYDPRSAALAVRLAEAYRRSGRIREAVLEAKQILKNDPDNLGAHRVLGHIYYQTLGELRQDDASRQTLGLAIGEYEQVTRLAPEDTGAWLTLARLRRMANDLEGAEAALKKLLEVEPSSEAGLAALAMLYSDQGQNEKAVELLENAAARGTSSSKVLSSLGYAYEQSEDFDSAARVYRRALEEDPDNLELRRRLAESLLRAERLEEAVAEYQALVQADSEDAETHLRLSQVYRHQGKFDKARAALESAKELSPDSLEIGFNESLLYEAQGDFQGAIEVLTGMVARMTRASENYTDQEQRSRAIVLERLGALHREEENFDEAVEVFRLLLPLGDEHAQRGYSQMIETQRRARRLEDALATAQAGVERFPQDEGLKLQMASLLSDQGHLEQAVQLARGLLDGSDANRQVYLTLTQIYQNHERFQEAEAALARAEQLSSPGIEAEQIHFLRGALYERQEQYDRAEEEFRQVLEMNPESAITLNYLGYMFADNDYRVEESVALIQRALEVDPYNGAYLDSLGWAYFRLENYEKAEEYLLKALDRLSSDPTIHDHLGDLYYETGRLRLAEKAWERAHEEWQRAPQTEFDREAFARLEEKLHRLRLRLARETQKKASSQ